MTASAACRNCLTDEKISKLTVCKTLFLYVAFNVLAKHRLGGLGAVISTSFGDDVNIGTLDGIRLQQA